MTLLPTHLETPDEPGVWRLSWSYPLQLDRISARDAASLLRDPQPYSALHVGELHQIPNTQDPVITGDVLQVPYLYHRRTLATLIAEMTLLFTVFGLVLLFLSLITHLLLEREQTVIAVLRSRGVRRRQILVASSFHSIGLGVVTLFIGPFLAIPLAYLVARQLLPSTDSMSLGNLVDDLPDVWLELGALALLTVSVVVVAMVWATNRAARHTILALRRTTSRSIDKPLWQRFYLDVLAALLGLAGYGAFAITNQVAAADGSATSANIQLALAPLALLAPMALLVASAFLLLRLYPALMRYCATLSARFRGPSIFLAFIQLARSSRSSARPTLLLALTTSFALATLMTTTTLTQYTRQAAAYQAGADFSGALADVASSDPEGLAASTAAYMALPGVIEAALGYRVIQTVPGATGDDVGGTNSANSSVDVLAVDSSSFAQAALWFPGEGVAPLSELMTQLATRRSDALRTGVAPAIVDAQTWRLLGLGPNASFALPAPGTRAGVIRFIALAKVDRIPTVYAGRASGVLVDYLTYASIYAQHEGVSAAPFVAPNFVWLRTRDDPTSLAHIRSALHSGPLRLTTLFPDDVARVPPADRRALEATLEGDPLYIGVLGILDLGGAAALLLALLGTLTAVWMAIGSQRRTLAALRALGFGPWRIATLTAWEQGIVYTFALVLGIVLGLLLARILLPALPLLIFSGAFGGPIPDGGPSAQLVWPWRELLQTLTPLAAIYGGSIFLVIATTLRASLGETLRLNED
jgi:hypothetical protein